MSDHATTNEPVFEENRAPASVDKGKGKAIEQHDDAMDEDESESEDSGAEGHHEELEEEDEDNMEEIDTENIIAGGRRTRGKDIDFAKAAEEMPEEDDEDEEEDDDFEEPDDSEMKD